MIRPRIIGITTFNQNEHGQYHVASACVEAVRSAGGLPVLLPPNEPKLSAILELVDGLIFSGGGDLNPDTYNGLLHPALSMVNKERDTFELTLARLALNTNIPLLGICRGTSVLNVASGGSLIAHIPDVFGEAIAHTGVSSQTVEHIVQVEVHSRLFQILGSSEVTVVSGHHQAINTVAHGWRVAAYAKDGVIEALEHEHHPWAYALQWHPELGTKTQQQQIFSALVQAAPTRKIVSQNEDFLTLCN